MRARALVGWSLVALGALLALADGAGTFDGRHVIVAVGLWLAWSGSGTEAAAHEKHNGRTTEPMEHTSMREAA